MTSQLDALCVDAQDPQALASFWAGVLDRERDDDGTALLPREGTDFRIRFLATEEPKTGRNQVHFDLTSASWEEQEATVARALEMGGRHLDIGQLPEEDHVVLADPEGNEFCVIEPGNGFLSGCGIIGALSSDGTRAVGCFWSEALAWPLVWDQDDETAIQSLHGGAKVSWGGPPVRAKTRKNRLHFDLAPEGDQQVEADRLVSLGATRVDGEPSASGRVAMLDPDGNEFCLLTPR